MTTEITNTAREFKNKKLRDYTNQIYKAGGTIKKAYARISVILNKIDLSQCYQLDGFDNVHDYSREVLGLNQSTSYALLAIGRSYIDAKTFESVLKHDDGNDFSTSQLQALLPLKSIEKAQELAENGDITPDMTVKEIKELVKSLKDNGNGESEPIEVEAVASSNVLDEETLDALNVCHQLEFAIDKDGKPIIVYGDTVIGVREAKRMCGEWLSGAWLADK